MTLPAPDATLDEVRSVLREDGNMSKPFYEIRFVRQLYRQQT